MIPRAVFGLALLVPVLVGGCANPSDVRVDLDEYSVEVDPVATDVAPVQFAARNVGSIAHQFIVLRTGRDPDDLPVRKGVAQLDASGIEVEGDIDLIASDDTEKLSLDLGLGDYVLICNIAGHYDNGMRARFRVEG